MRYIVIAEDSNQLRVEFAQQEEAVLFSTYEEAQAFIEQVHEENVLPDKYQLRIERYEREETLQDKESQS
ncbi:hypothetical protein GCM10007216_36120 [Thalassobacillus devorans]|uniref:DUF3906 family protein n=1 Tax=Thalassobacillus devorans TaxID=279813 RepID=A0ABQ1PS54_9BACI|nr:hypothetical protein [Thalassobacillus devorans]NIK30532.1 hypothetical protein [Thalassobacillus devorans]GGD02203.1 hypothetical protein GCM10007216_36120 [Thalassobacillus devorans]